MRAIVLGSGTSAGVPVIGCDCSICQSDDPKNKRTRSSIVVEKGKTRILIDTAPEMRIQIVNAGIRSIDAVMYTHLHADHSAGFDDLRAFWFHSKENMPVYLRDYYMAELKKRFYYAFENTGYLGAVPQTDLRDIPDNSFRIGDIEVEPIDLPHGNVSSTAFLMGSFAYATDFKRFSPEQIANWRGRIHTMVSGIHFGSHNTHSVIPETVALFEELEVKRGIITHLSHDVDYEKHQNDIPHHCEFAYDGMIIDLP
ncbi:MAG: MBL fold metallo-hydrolase [Pseudobacteriovorax sp.]|nr:MBL fold metallo-hydrolase [Pseudobacteriovorax sp.]